VFRPQDGPSSQDYQGVPTVLLLMIIWGLFAFFLGWLVCSAWYASGLATGERTQYFA
jgi:hypothetical protein